jgi:hypothetical protein
VAEFSDSRRFGAHGGRTADILKRRADTIRDQAAKARREQTKTDILAAISAASRALEAIGKQLATQPKETAVALGPQIENIRALLQGLKDNPTSTKPDDGKLALAQNSIAEIQNAISRIDSSLRTNFSATPAHETLTIPHELSAPPPSISQATANPMPLLEPSGEYGSGG